MLDFMREQKNNDSSPQQQNSGVDNSSASKSGDEQEYISVTNQDKNTRKSTILFAVLFSAGLFCLIFMVNKTTPQTVSAAVNTEEIQMEKIVASMTGTKNQASDDIEEVIKQFSEFSNVKQVPNWCLAKNPFKHEIFPDNTLDNTKLNLDSSVRQVGLELFSVMKSGGVRSGWCCMIDDKLLYEGDSIKGFEVLEINKNTVTLESEGTETVLKLTE